MPATAGTHQQAGAADAGVLTDCEIEGGVANEICALHLPTPDVSPKIRAFVDFFVDRFDVR